MRDLYVTDSRLINIKHLLVTIFAYIMDVTLLFTMY